MSTHIGKTDGISRRGFLIRSASTIAVSGAVGVAAPFLSRAADRPLISGGL